MERVFIDCRPQKLIRTDFETLRGAYRSIPHNTPHNTKSRLQRISWDDQTYGVTRSMRLPLPSTILNRLPVAFALAMASGTNSIRAIARVQGQKKVGPNPPARRNHQPFTKEGDRLRIGSLRYKNIRRNPYAHLLLQKVTSHLRVF